MIWSDYVTKYIHITIVICTLYASAAFSSSDTEIVVQDGKGFEKKELRIEKPECTAPEMRISQGKICGGAYIYRVLGNNNGHQHTFRYRLSYTG
jgi:hypothetical protein